MLRSLAVHSKIDYALKVALAHDAGEPGLHSGLLVLLAVVVREPVLLLVKEID